MQILTKKQYNLNALMLSILGVGCFAFGIYMFASPKHTVNINQIKGEKFEACKKAVSLTNMGVAADLPKNKITVLSPDLSNFKATLASTSFIISECDGFEMEEMCLGTSCSSSGLVMDLTYTGSQHETNPTFKGKIKDAISK